MIFKSEAWNKASDGDKMRRTIITIALKNFPDKCAWLFKESAPEMFSGADEIWKESGCFSSGERTIIGFALSVWFDTSHANLCDIIHRLDDSNFRNMSMAMGIWRAYKTRGVESAMDEYNIAKPIGRRPL